MLKNYFKIAFRNLFKHRVYSFINIFGLAVGLACCLLIGLYVQNEWNYDNFHSNSDRIYRAWAEGTRDDGQVILNTATPIILAPTLRENIPEVERATYLYNFNNLVQRPLSSEAMSENILVANSDFFHIFDFKLIEGNRSSVFGNPSSVVLSEETARKFFGEENPIQQTLSIRLGSEFRDFTVTGILENLPSNSSFPYNILIPYANLDQLVDESNFDNWFNVVGSTYVLLQEGTNFSELDAKFQSMLQAALGEDFFNQTNYRIGLQPLTDIHLNPEFPAMLHSVSDPSYSYILAAIALLVLLIACVNFMTLSISKSASRGREIGIRKTIGAIRQHIMYQFWGEALIMTILALFVGIVLCELLLPFFNDLSGTSLAFNFSVEMMGTLAGLAVLISLISGIYPALILSGFRPVEVLKGRLNLSADKSLFRQTMVVMQFALSITFIFGAITVRQQLNYVQNKNLGYQKDQVVVIESGYSAGATLSLDDVILNSFQRKERLQNSMYALPEVESIAASSFSPVEMGGWFSLEFGDNMNQQHAYHGNIVDADFIPSLGTRILEGRNFSGENPSDEIRAIIVNQAMVEYFGWENSIGERLPGPEFDDHEIIGVVEDFHYESLHTPVEPLVLAMSPALLFSGINNMNINSYPSPRYSIKLNTSDLSGTMADIQNIWESIAPGVPFDFTFVDQALDAQYHREQRLSRIVTAGTLFAIVIACLGLFGLASLMVVRKTKEIGVRKVLGASASNIVFMVNKEFTKLVIIAFVISVPVAWYLMSNWLQNFAYRIEIGPGTILLAGITALVVAWLTVSYQSVKATLVDPVNSLRSE